jgi:uncharacterized OB-fold protein
MSAHPRPMLDADNAAFWEGCREHKLVMQRCDGCSAWRFPPRPRCPSCLSIEWTWAELSGDGEVVSFTICHPPVLPAFRDRTPYNVIVVQLDEGPMLVSNLLDAEPATGLRVGVTYLDVDDELTLPQFVVTTAS